MTQDTFDRRLTDWLDEGPGIAPADILEAVGVELPGTARRSRPMIVATSLAANPAVGWAAAAAAVVLAIGVGLALVVPRAQVGSPDSPTAPTLVPTAPPPLLTMPPAEGWVTFASPMNGLHLSLPGDWTMTPASEPWGYGADTKEDSPWLDRASSADGRLEFFARATDLPRSMTIADWIEAYELETGTCSTPVPWVPVTAPIGEWSMREICGRFVGLGVVDGVRGIVLSMRPTIQQTTHAQIDADTELFAAIIGSVGSAARTD